MPDVRPDIAPEQVLALLEEKFGKPVTALTPITEGLIARTFSFHASDGNYVIRFQTKNMLAHYEKEKHVCEHYASPHIPIPTIDHIGQHGELYYAISRKVPGRTLSRLSSKEYRQALPSVVETLFAIHRVDVSERSNYGLFDGQGNGIFPSWRSSLAAIANEDPEWDFYGKWHVLFDNSILERDVFNQIYDRMIGLLEYCPEERYLVHGGYGFGNVLAQDGRVTGVVDWMDARYGDFVYDIAWLDYFSPSYRHQQVCCEYYAARGFSIPYFPERLLCYMCYMALDGLRFFAKVNDTDGYRWTRERILNLLFGEQA